MPDRVEVQGDTRLRATLALAAHRVQDMSEPGKAAGRVLVGSARAGAPVRTGRLAASVHADTSDTETVVASDLVYAPVIHFGWHRHHISPNPFLYRALDNTEPVVVAAYQARVRTVLAGVKGA
jgi:phage gpG-like protein